MKYVSLWSSLFHQTEREACQSVVLRLPLKSIWECLHHLARQVLNRRFFAPCLDFVSSVSSLHSAAKGMWNRFLATEHTGVKRSWADCLLLPQDFHSRGKKGSGKFPEQTRE